MRRASVWLLALIPSIALAQMGRGMGPGMMGGGPTPRHFYAMHHGIDPQYARLRNPLPASARNVAAGKKLFEQYCSACHGATGRGDGPGAKALDPAPATLAGLSRVPVASDGFYFWTLSEGGAQFKSAMPPFKGALEKEQIWQVVLYLRTL